MSLDRDAGRRGGDVLAEVAGDERDGLREVEAQRERRERLTRGRAHHEVDRPVGPRERVEGEREGDRGVGVAGAVRGGLGGGDRGARAARDGGGEDERVEEPHRHTAM